MRLIPRGPVAVASRAWGGPSGPTTTIVARVTYELWPLASRVSLTPEEPCAEDRWAPGASGALVLVEPNDLVPLKGRADVVVVGRVYAPGRPVAELEARIIVGELEKAIWVTGQRHFGPGGAPTAPTPFTQAPMDYTAAAGGDDSWNPLGVRAHDRDALSDTSRAPTVLPLGTPLEHRDAYVAPAGLGPIPPTWTPRAERLSAQTASWRDLPASAQAYWPGGDTSFFQAAPADQQLARALRGDERLVLENLHPQHARLVTSLPGVAVKASIVEGATNEPIAMVGDTLWIDTDRGIATITFRGSKPTDRLRGRDVVVWLDGFAPRASDGVGSQTIEVAVIPGGGFPFSPPEEQAAARASQGPPARPAPQASSAADELAYQRMATGTIAGPDRSAGAAATPFAGRAPEPPPSSPRAVIASPALAPPLAPPVAPAAAGTGFVQREAQAAAPAPAWQPPAPAPPAPAPRIDTWKLHEEASRKGADAPDGAPAPDARASSPEPAATQPAAAIEVAWIDSSADVELAGRSRTLTEQVGDDEIAWMSTHEAAEGSANRARADVARYLRRAAPRPLDDLQRLLIDALEANENERPFVVLSGELTWTFDLRASIRAWVALAGTLAADPRVKEAIEGAERTLADTAAAPPDVLVAPYDRLRDAVRGITKVVGTVPVEAAVERFLIEERSFGRRKVWGANRLRAHLAAKGSRTPVPVYMTETAGPEAPLSQRFPVRLLAELRTRQDPTEPSPVCLRAIAYGLEIVETPARSG